MLGLFPYWTPTRGYFSDVSGFCHILGLLPEQNDFVCIRS